MFSIHTLEKGCIPAMLLLGADDATYTVGQALLLTGGHLIACTGANKPQYISCQNKTVTVDGQTLAVMPVDSQTVYETTFSVASADVAAGDKVTLSSDGKKVTATETNGVATVIAKSGAAAGDTVYVKFI